MTPSASVRRASEYALLLGSVVGTVGVALAMVPGSYAVYGPAKGLLLVIGAFLCSGGLFAGGAGTTSDAEPGGGRSRPPLAVYALVLFALLIILSFATSIDRRLSLLGPYPEYVGTVPMLAALLIGVASFEYARRKPDLSWLVTVYVVALAAISGYALAQALGVDFLELRSTLSTNRVRSTLGNPSNLGVFLVGAIPYVLWSAREGRARPKRIASAVVAAMATLSLLLTLSRGAWVGAAVATVVWLVLSVRHRSLTSVRVVLLRSSLPVALVCATILLIPDTRARVLSFWAEPGGTGAWRLMAWGEWLSLIAESPLLGFGTGASSLAAASHVSAQVIAGAGSQHTLGSAHNVLLDVASGSGLIALAAILLLFGLALKCAWRAEAPGRQSDMPVPELTASLVGMLVALQFHFLTLDTLALLCSTTGLLFGVCAHRETRMPVSFPTAAGIPWSRLVGGALLVATFGVVIAFSLLVAADRAVLTNLEALENGRSWSEAAAEFESIRRLAPWEHAYSAAFASAAAQVSLRGGGPEVADEGLAVIGRAIDAHPLDSTYFRHKGDLLSAKAKLTESRPLFTQALGSYEEALVLAPHDVRALVGAGTSLLALGDAEESVPYLEKALLIDADFAPARETLALVRQSAP